MPLTSATASSATASSTTTIAMWFVEQVHLLRVYCTDTPALTKGNLLKNSQNNIRKPKALTLK